MPSAKKYLDFQKAIQNQRLFCNSFSNGIDRLNDTAKGIIPSTKEEWEHSQTVLKKLQEVAVGIERRNERRAAKKAERKSKAVRGGRR